MNNDKNKITFEEFGIEFTDEDFEGVNKETLEECKRKIDEEIVKLNELKEKNNG